MHNSPLMDKKKKKLDVKEVFNNDEDEDSTMGGKKRKLVPLGKRQLGLILCPV